MQGVSIPFLPDRETWVKTVRERDNLAAQLAQAQAERDNARAEVARLTAALTNEQELRKYLQGNSSTMSYTALVVEVSRLNKELAALRGDTAPAQVMTGAAERTIEWE